MKRRMNRKAVRSANGSPSLRTISIEELQRVQGGQPEGDCQYSVGWFEGGQIIIEDRTHSGYPPAN